MAAEVISPAQADAFVDKLREFSKQLSSEEQALLGEILMRAVAPGEDVEGHQPFFDPIIVTHAASHAPIVWQQIHLHVQELVRAMNAFAAHHPAVHHQAPGRPRILPIE